MFAKAIGSPMAGFGAIALSKGPTQSSIKAVQGAPFNAVLHAE